MKKWQAYLLLLAGMGLFIRFLVWQSEKETSLGKRVHRKYIEPFVQAELNGVTVAITRASFDFDNFTDQSRALQFDYLDVNTNARGRLYTSNRELIQLEDTIRKPTGANYFSLTRKGKGLFYFSYPIDLEKQKFNIMPLIQHYSCVTTDL